MNEVDKTFREIVGDTVSDECAACGSITCSEPGGWECNVLTLYLSDREPLGEDCHPGEIVECRDLGTWELVYPNTDEFRQHVREQERKAVGLKTAGIVEEGWTPRPLAGPRDVLALVENHGGRVIAVKVPAASVGKVAS